MTGSRQGMVALVVVWAASFSVAAPASGSPLPERSLQRLEQQLLGSAHAAEHAAQRAEMRRWHGLSRAARRSALRQQARPHAHASNFDPQQYGQWLEPGPGGGPFKLPTYAIHAALLPTGRVILWGYPATDRYGQGTNNQGDGWLWDPARGYGSDAFTPVPPPSVPIAASGAGSDPRPAPIYCSGESLLANGDLFITGGNLDLSSSAGATLAFTFDPFRETWQQQGNLTQGRWYPSQVELPDGRIAVLGGNTAGGAGSSNPLLEVWPAPGLPVPTDATRDAAGVPFQAEPTASRAQGTALYPHLMLTPAGKVMLAGPGNSDSALLDPGTYSWQSLPALPGGRDRIGSNAVELPGPGGSTRVMDIGGYDYSQFAATGSALASSSTASIDTRGGSWSTDGAGQSVGRAYGNTVMLPDGAMVTIGGSAGRSTQNGQGTYWTNGNDQRLKSIELYDPATGSWRFGPAENQFRGYHSIALLLPDGSVLSGGDDLHEDQFRGSGNAYIGSAEIYRPPYLFQPGTRPRIRDAPQEIGWGRPFGISSPDEIRSAVLMAPSAVTHGADMTQRRVPLAMTASVAGGGATLMAPAAAAVAPPGWYMLFALNAGGVPSVARWVHLGAPSEAAAAAPPPALAQSTISAGGGVLGGGVGGVSSVSIPGPTRLAGLEVRPRALRPARRGGSLARAPARHPSGARLSFTLSRSARVSFRIERCRRSRCRAVGGGFQANGRAGANGLHFSGRLGGRALSPGFYRLSARAGTAQEGAPFAVR